MLEVVTISQLLETISVFKKNMIISAVTVPLGLSSFLLIPVVVPPPPLLVHPPPSLSPPPFLSLPVLFLLSFLLFIVAIVLSFPSLARQNSLSFYSLVISNA